MWNMEAQRMKVDNITSGNQWVKSQLYMIKRKTLGNFRRVSVSPNTFFWARIQNLGPTEVEEESPKQITDFIPGVMLAVVKEALPQLTAMQDRVFPADLCQGASVVLQQRSPMSHSPGHTHSSASVSQSCCSPLLAWSSSNKNSLSCGMTSNYMSWLLLISFL